MRSLAANAVIAGLLARSVAAGPSPCLTEKIIKPTDRCHSARAADLKLCLNDILDDVSEESLRNCFVKAGCEELDAKFEAQWVVESCRDDTELRRRQNDKEEEDDKDDKDNKDEEATTEKNTKTTAKQEEEEDEPTKTAKNTKTAEKTIKEEEEAQPTEAPQPDEQPISTTLVIETVQPSDPISNNNGNALPQETAATATSTSSGGATTAAVDAAALTCFTTITFTTEGWDIINTDTAGRVSRTFNSNKVGVKTKCADGMVCRNQSCMEADNSLRGSGIAVAIFFGATAAVSIAALLFLCCRDRRNDKKLRAKAEAAKLTKEAAKPAAAAVAGRSVSAGRRSPSGNDRQPLMNQGMYPPSPGGSQGRPSHDPFGDQRRM